MRHKNINEFYIDRDLYYLGCQSATPSPKIPQNDTLLLSNVTT
jgi:hypothetical protein